MQVTITFNLSEDVTPEIFARKLSDMAHLNYLIREDETITVGPLTFTVPEGYDEATRNELMDSIGLPWMKI